MNLQEGQARVERAILNVLREDARWSNISASDAPPLPKSQAKQLLQRVFAPHLQGTDDVELIVALRNVKESNKSQRDSGKRQFVIYLLVRQPLTNRRISRDESLPEDGAVAVGVQQLGHQRHAHGERHASHGVRTA